MGRKAKSLYLSDDRLEKIDKLIANRMKFSQFINVLIDQFFDNNNGIENNEVNINETDLVQKTIRLNGKEAEYFTKKSNENRSSFSQEVRKVIISGMSNKSILTQEDKSVLRDAESNLKKIGINLNQIAKWFNIKKELFSLNNNQIELIVSILNKTIKEFDDLKNILVDIHNKTL